MIINSGFTPRIIIDTGTLESFTIKIRNAVAIPRLNKLLGKNKKEKEKTELEKKQEELEGMGEKDAFKKNLEDKKKKLEELKEAISKQASQAGTSTNRDVRTVNDLSLIHI